MLGCCLLVTVPAPPPAPLPRTVRILGAVSFLNDAASEMIAPLMPRFVQTTLGAGPAALGVIEGIAETTAALLKLYSGVLADRFGRLKQMTLAGYVLANVCRPLSGFVTSWPQLLAVRFGDRVGKGLRTTPRDRLLADAAPPEVRGRAFGFHRAMDNAGAVAGPLLALLCLGALGLDMRTLFIVSAVPGLLGVLLLGFGLSEPKAPPRVETVRPRLPASPEFRRYLFATLTFALGNATDPFIMWRANELGVGLDASLLFWIALHAIRSAMSTPGGALSDRFGRRRVLAGAWALFALGAMGLAFATGPLAAWGLMVVLGVATGAMDGVEKALAVDLAPPGERGRALGADLAARGLAALPSAALFGFAYQTVGARFAFGGGAILCGLAAALLLNVGGGKTAPRID
jgi:MFS family permease